MAGINIKTPDSTEAGLIFTLDYEIHGNGNGEFENWAWFPTEKMLEVFDAHGARLTIMAEMGHYWAMKRYEDRFITEINLFETQLKDAVARGHDVQLHFHPQWIDATLEDSGWNLEFSKRTIERLCYNYDEALFYLKKGKEDLEKLLQPVNPDYRCVCFRAGFLQMQPSANMIKALTDAGFLSDSSVSKGMTANDSLRLLDFSDAYSGFRPWSISGSEICNHDPDGKIVEFPILSYSRGLTDKVINKLKKIKGDINVRDLISYFMARYGKGMPSETKRSVVNKFNALLKEEWGYADFCLKDPPLLIRQVRKAISENRRSKDRRYLPLVFIGHSKDLFFSNRLASLFRECKKIKSLEFITYSDAVKKFINS